MSRISNIISNGMKDGALRSAIQNRSKVAPALLPGVKLDDLMELRCKNCGGESFYPIHLLRGASPFQSMNSKPTLVQLPLGFACADCNQINSFHEVKKEAPASEETPPDLGISVAEKTETDEKVG